MIFQLYNKPVILAMDVKSRKSLILDVLGLKDTNKNNVKTLLVKYKSEILELFPVFARNDGTLCDVIRLERMPGLYDDIPLEKIASIFLNDEQRRWFKFCSLLFNYHNICPYCFGKDERSFFGNNGHCNRCGATENPRWIYAWKL